MISKTEEALNEFLKEKSLNKDDVFIKKLTEKGILYRKLTINEFKEVKRNY